MGAVNKIRDFFRGVVFELGKVNWPTRREVIYLTLIVIISMGVAMAFIAGVDFTLSKILEFVISRK